MKLLCIRGLPQQGLISGVIYKQADFYSCVCGKNPGKLASIVEVRGVNRKAKCKYCGGFVPQTPNGWFFANRFIPWNKPPRTSHQEVDDLYRAPPLKKRMKRKDAVNFFGAKEKSE